MDSSRPSDALQERRAGEEERLRRQVAQWQREALALRSQLADLQVAMLAPVSVAAGGGIRICTTCYMQALTSCQQSLLNLPGSKSQECAAHRMALLPPMMKAQSLALRVASQEAAELPANVEDAHAQLADTRAALAALQRQHAALRKCVLQLNLPMLAQLLNNLVKLTACAASYNCILLHILLALLHIPTSVRYKHEHDISPLLPPQGDARTAAERACGWGARSGVAVVSCCCTRRSACA